MKRDDASPDPSLESLAEMPETDFSTAVRPNRYANLRGEFQHAVFLDRDLIAHFGSAEKVVEALRLLAELGEKSRPRGAA
jgi:hypothetical protein